MNARRQVLALALPRLTWVAAGGFALVLVAAFLRSTEVSASLRLGLASLTILAALSPASALTVFLAVSPFATVLKNATGAPISGAAIAEAMALATTGCWMLRMGIVGTPVPAGLRRAAAWSAALAALAVMSCAVLLSALALQIGGTGTMLRELGLFVVRDYFRRSNSFVTVVLTLSLLEGLALLLMTATVCIAAPGLRRRLAVAICAGSAGAAAFNLKRMLGAALASATPLSTFTNLLLQVRISQHYDRNAAGSVFAMTTFVAIGLFSGTRRRRAIVLVAGLLILAGLWLTGSRSALAAVLVAGIVLAVFTGWTHADRLMGRRALVAGIGILAVGIGLAAFYPAERNPTVPGSITGRRELAIAAVRMFEAHPAFGVGIGQFFDLSDDYGRPQMAKVLPPGQRRENAHNNFLQVLAELGLTGLVSLVGLLAVTALPAFRAARAGRDLPLAAGVACGVLAFVLTWLTGHPLLVPEAVYPFFALLGLTAAFDGGGDAAARTAPGRRRLAMAAIALMAIALPFRIAAARRNMNLEHVGYGVSAWQVDSEGVRFRWAGAEAVLFVPSDAGGVQVLLRKPPGAPPLEVELRLDGRLADRVLLMNEDWRTVPMAIPPVAAKYRRLDLSARALEPSGLPSLMIGRVRPAVDTGGMSARRARAAVGDYDGDGRSDIAVYRPSTGEWLILDKRTTRYGDPGDHPVPADYDGDWRTDVAVFRPATSTWYVAGRLTATFGDPGDVPVPGDYAGDGSADLAVYRPSTGMWYIRNGQTVQYGDPGDLPAPSDYDGDGRTDIAVFRPSNGIWYARGQFFAGLGRQGDVPVPGDYDGSGSDEPAVFRPTTGEWLIQGQAEVTFGEAGDMPVPGDYDGDGTMDLAVYRPSTGTWLVRGLSPVHHGDPGDVPLRPRVRW